MKETISEYDRLQGLLRLPQFQGDVRKIKDEYNWQRKERLKSKFSEKYSVHFADIEFISNHFTFLPQFPTNKDSPVIKGLCKDILATPGVTLLDKITADSHFEKASLTSGKYLAVMVDLSQNKSKILSDFENLIDSMFRHTETISHFCEENRGKTKEFKYSIWLVYDMCSEKKKPNFTDVARRLTGRSGQARDDDCLRAGLKAVRRAYKRAKEIMQEVEETIPKGVDV
ncbi:MAG: hypothetical protein CV087_02350 [Candidatus Brocadia sp. WS118]|nr:MAG: hypothetical protein CV087_02350 [Candidatus Brocadia sp. WS118]